MEPLSREVKRAAIALCDALAGSRSSEIKSLILAGEWDRLASLKLNPQAYATPESYFADAACIGFLKKYEPLPTTFDRKKVAVDAFWEAERACFATNRRLAPFVYNTFQGEVDERLFEFIKDVRKEVELVLGKSPGDPQGKFGPGATSSDPGRLSTIPDKMQSLPTLTHDAWPFLVPWSGTLWGAAAASRGDRIFFVDHNVFTTAKKDCTKDRGICKEPPINVFYQLGMGRQIRDKLRNSGNNLDTAQERHRQVACAASRDALDVTIDLHQASDYKATMTVKLLLPDQWYEPLFDLRSPKTLINTEGVERVVVLEKFSSMGNGYTFELETLIFQSICAAVYRRAGLPVKIGRNLHVYGDDIIVKADLARDVVAALQFFGFKVNEEKSFFTGPFRESCGGDYFNGVDVRPFFLKEEPCEPQHYIAMANGVRRMGNPRETPDRWSALRRVWFGVLDCIPSHIRNCRGPEDLGDLVVHDESYAWDSSQCISGIRHFRVYQPARFRTVSRRVFDDEVILAGALYGMPWADGRGVMPRDSVLGYRIGWVPPLPKRWVEPLSVDEARRVNTRLATEKVGEVYGLCYIYDLLKSLAE